MNSEGKKALFLIPCCSEKRPYGNDKPWNVVRSNHEKNKLPFLDDFRLQMIDFYSVLPREDAINYYLNRGSKAWQKNFRLHECKTMKTINRYNGVLYKSLSPDIMKRLHNSEFDNVLIVSALMGMVFPTDLIPDYELMMKDKSPNNRKVWGFWREAFATDIVKKHLQQVFSKFDYIYCLMSTTTGYVDSVAKFLSDYPSYCILSQESDTRSILRSWGRVLNEILLKGYNTPEEVKIAVEMHNCEMEKLFIQPKNIKKKI